MSDNIKLPPVPDEIFEAPGPIWGHILDWDAAEPGPAAGKHADAIDAAITRVMHEHAREAVRLNATVPGEPDWRHPKIQGLIGSEARLRIAIDLMWQILEDPNQEFTASDMEYWDTIHDKLKAALSAAPAAPAAPQPTQPLLTDEQIYSLYRRAGLEAYHLRHDVVQYAYDKCINDFARAIEQASRNRSQE